MEARRLKVIIGGSVAGTLSQGASGAISFEYEGHYDGPPLSISMPNDGRLYGDKVVKPYLEGLLPESNETKREIANRYGTSPRNPFALLEHVGLDCPGAVQICTEDLVESALLQEGELIALSNKAIAEKLRRVMTGQQGWISNREHWSLGGQQSKFALRKKEGQWYMCEGAAATTHIIKPGIEGLKMQALNEFLCIKTAEKIGLSVENVSYEIFDGTPAIVAERFDRVSRGSEVARIHQEDLCQALGYSPDKKYPEDGGPGASEVIGLLKETGRDARSNIQGFIDQLFFNYLTGSPDAHAKNYSVLLSESRQVLAPMYDVASNLPYVDRPFDTKLAMGISGQNRICKLGLQRLERFATTSGLGEYGIDGGLLARRLRGMAESIPDAMSEAARDFCDIPGMDELSNRLVPLVASVCSRSLDRIAADSH